MCNETIFDSKVDGNMKVLVDVFLDDECAIPILTKKGINKMSHEVGSHLL